MNIKITISVLIAFIISFSSFVIFLNWTSEIDELAQWKNEFFSQDFDLKENKVVILGSSQVGRLNATYIENEISDEEFTVYNLGIAANRPQHRFASLDQIIAMEPDLVIYGIGYRDFENTHKPHFEKPTSSLPDPKEFFESQLILNSPLEIDTNLFRFPKANTLQFIRSIGADEPDPRELIFDPKMPFYHPEKHPREPIVSIDGLIEEVSATSWFGIKPYERNLDVKILKQIIQKLKDNDIKVIIFTAPHNKIFLDETPNEYHEFIDTLIENIENEKKISVYKLHDKYKQNDIWYDYLHIAIHPDVNIFNDDISEIVKKELRQ